MVLLGLSFVVGTAIVVGLSITVTSGLARLDSASRHVAAGDYGFRVPVDGEDDEFTRVGRTFNDMAAALAVAIDETQAARARAEAASAAKSGFLTSLCHDLKTPLTAILGYADVIEADVRQAGLATPAADIGQLRRSARVLLGMVAELLDYARLEVGRMPIAFEAGDPAGLVEDVAGTLKPLLEQRGNRFVLTDLRTASATLTTDHGKLRHILINLLGNACKFTAGGQVEVVLRDTDTHLLLDVRDTGIGMDEAECGRVFAPYVQANNQIVQRFGGSGLGLAISKQFAQLLGGDITVVSTPGAGSCFTLSLPDHAPTGEERLDLPDLDEAVALFAALDAPAPPLDA
jgi:signal transduction histidine kinase